MSLEKRLELIKKIEKIRKTKVITYVISDRQNIDTMIQEDDVRELYEHIKDVSKTDKVDLFIYSRGGDATVAWTLANLMKEMSLEFNVLIPFKAFSCATAISIGASKIIMHRMGSLGPVDPMVANFFNPRAGNQVLPISVEDVAGFLSFIKENFGIKNNDHRIKVEDEESVMKTFEKLCSCVHPLALGNVYRHYLKSRDDTKKLLELNLDPSKDKKRIEKIIETLVEKLYYHGHHINRKEAQKIGLNVEFAEKYSNGEHTLDDILWQLYLEYEKDLSLNIPYVDELPASGGKNEIPIKFIESEKLSSNMIVEQNFIDMGFPQGSILSIMGEQQFGVILPNTPSPIPVYFSAQPVSLNNKIYDKRETNIWKRQKP